MNSALASKFTSVVYIYDNTFEGLLTTIFECYAQKNFQAIITAKEAYVPLMFAEIFTIETNADKASRVWKGLVNKLSPGERNLLVKCFLSELPQREEIIFHYVQYALRSTINIGTDYGNKYVLELAQIGKMVGREKHRMEAFVRFQKLKDETYFAVVGPDFDVMPLIAPHFKRRYADQKWIIYDIKRKYGIAYDLEKVTQIKLDFEKENIDADNVVSAYDEEEVLYQTLWKAYFNSVNIKERKNMKLHLRSMPRRYWKYLTEKML